MHSGPWWPKKSGMTIKLDHNQGGFDHLKPSNGSFPLGGCLFFSWGKSSTHPKKLEQEYCHHIDKRTLLSIFIDFCWLLRKTFQTSYGAQAIGHCILKEFLTDMNNLPRKSNFPSPLIVLRVVASFPSCSSFFATAAPSRPCGWILQQLPILTLSAFLSWKLSVWVLKLSYWNRLHHCGIFHPWIQIQKIWNQNISRLALVMEPTYEGKNPNIKLNN